MGWCTAEINAKLNSVEVEVSVRVEVTTCPDGWVGGGLNENNAILNDVVVEVGVELCKNNILAITDLILFATVKILL